MRQNQRLGFELVRDWDVVESDIRAVDWTALTDAQVDLVAGGPPCQPFSMGGKHGADGDHRDMFPATAEVIRQLRPKAFIVENVKGLTRSKFANYFHYIQLRLSMPALTMREGENWGEHYARLQGEQTSATSHGLTYNVVPALVNAADYGVPQKRERIFMVGFRSDVDADWAFPVPTHSQAALLHSQWETGEYWELHKVGWKHRPSQPARGISLEALEPGAQPWRTVRDALVGLPEPTARTSRAYLNHSFQDGARVYPGHTGSPLDEPAKTLKAGGHGVPGGENMLRRVDGSVRYFTVRESARLQTFPDDYELHGSWSEAMRQLGNAVPVLLAEVVASSVAEHLRLAAERNSNSTRLKLVSA